MQKVYFADCLPGYGKTFWAIKQMVVANKSKSGVTLYVAPTHLLLQEVYDRLIDCGVPKSDIFHITQIDDYTYSASVRLGEILTGNTEGTNSPNSRPEVDNGDIILTTQSNLWNCYLKEMLNREQFPTRKDIRVIIDEARNCQIKSTRISLQGTTTINTFLSILNLPQEFCTSRKYWATSFGKHHLDMLREKLGNDFCKRITHLAPKQISDAPFNRFYIYMSMSGGSFSQGTITIQCVMAPFSLLGGWKSFTTLSAQYRTSQFYHLLKLCADKDKLDADQRMLVGDCPSIELIDITDKVVSPKRHALMQKRFENTTFGYLLENDLSKDKLDGYLIKSGKTKYLVREARHLHDLIKKAYDTNLYNLSALLKKPISDRKSEFNAIKASRLKVCTFLGCSRNKETGELKPVNALRWLCRKADLIAKEWIDNPDNHCELPDSHHYFLLGINKTAGYFSSYDKSKELFDQVVPKGIHAKNISGDVRGLDCYKGYDVVAFFASTRLPPELKLWFKQFCPEYDPEMDTMVGTALQTICRCSIRDGNSESKPLVLVTSAVCVGGLINLLDNYFPGYKSRAKVLTPEDFGCNSYVAVNTLNNIGESTKFNRLRFRKYYQQESAKQQRKEYNSNLKTQARKLFYYNAMKNLKDEKYAIDSKIAYYKRKQDLVQVEILREKQSKLASLIAVKTKPLQKEFKEKWEVDTAFTEELIKNLQKA